MTSIFHIKADELSPDFIEAVKKMFSGKNITLTVDVDIDETEYLLRSQANRDMLMKSIRQAEEGDLVNYTIDN